MNGARKAVVCELGTCAISLTVFDSSERKPALLWERSARFSGSTKDTAVAGLLAGLLDQLAEEHSLRGIHATYLLLKPGLYEPRIQHAEHSFKESRLITKALVDSLVSGSEETLESRLLSVICNGYPVVRWEHRTAQSLGYSRYEALGDRKRILAQTEPLLRLTRGATFEIHTSALVTFTVLRDILDADTGFIFADISGDQTQIVVVKAGVLQGIRSFTNGYEDIATQVASHLGTIQEEAELALHLLAQGKLNKVETARTARAWKNSSAKWNAELEHALAALSGSMALPPLLLVGGRGALGRMASLDIKKNGFGDAVKFSGDFSVQYVGSEFFAPFVRSGLVVKKDDADLLMEGIFVSRNRFI